jgi:hypothetical protein
MFLGSTQPPTEMSIRNIYVQSGLPNCMKCENLEHLESSGLVQARNRYWFNLLAFNIYLLYNAAFMFLFPTSLFTSSYLFWNISRLICLGGWFILPYIPESKKQMYIHNRKETHFPSGFILSTDGEISTYILTFASHYKFEFHKIDVNFQWGMQQVSLKDFTPSYTSLKLVLEKCLIYFEKINNLLSQAFFTHLHLVSRLRMTGALLLQVHPLYVKMAWTGITLPFYVYESGVAKTLRNGIEVLKSVLSKIIN